LLICRCLQISPSGSDSLFYFFHQEYHNAFAKRATLVALSNLASLSWAVSCLQREDSRKKSDSN
jgi:hypothetical protein